MNKKDVAKKMSHNEKRDSMIREKIHSGDTGIKKAKKKVRYLSESEQKAKTKNWPKHHKEPDHKEYQNRIGRAYND